LKSLIKKSSDNSAKITKLEKEVLEGLNKNKNWISKKVSKEAAELVLRKSLSKISLSQIIKTVYKLGKKNPTKFNLMKLGLQIGGAWYSWDKLAEIYGIKEKTDSTTKSKIVKPEIVTDFDKNWDYKKEGDKYFARKKGTPKEYNISKDKKYSSSVNTLNTSYPDAIKPVSTTTPTNTTPVNTVVGDPNSEAIKKTAEANASTGVAANTTPPKSEQNAQPATGGTNFTDVDNSEFS
jgi:hypothetical protein